MEFPDADAGALRFAKLPPIDALTVSFATLAGLHMTTTEIAAEKANGRASETRKRAAEKDSAPDDEDDDIAAAAEKRAKALTGNEDEDDDDTASIAAARRRERARCGRIFAHPACATQEGLDLAARLAFETQMSRTEALTVLDSMAGTARMTRRMADCSGRAARNPQIGTSGGGMASSSPVSRMIELMKKSREGR